MLVIKRGSRNEPNVLPKDGVYRFATRQKCTNKDVVEGVIRIFKLALVQSNCYL